MPAPTREKVLFHDSTNEFRQEVDYNEWAVLDFAWYASKKYSLLIKYLKKQKYVTPKNCYRTLKSLKVREVLLVRILEPNDKGARFD